MEPKSPKLIDPLPIVDIQAPNHEDIPLMNELSFQDNSVKTFNPTDMDRIEAYLRSNSMVSKKDYTESLEQYR